MTASGGYLKRNNGGVWIAANKKDSCSVDSWELWNGKCVQGTICVRSWCVVDCQCVDEPAVILHFWYKTLAYILSFSIWSLLININVIKKLSFLSCWLGLQNTPTALLQSSQGALPPRALVCCGWWPVMHEDWILMADWSMTLQNHVNSNTPLWPLLVQNEWLERPSLINWLVMSSPSIYATNNHINTLIQTSEINSQY